MRAFLSVTVAATWLLAAVIAVTPVDAQTSPKADDLIGTWQLVSTKNIKTGAVTPNSGNYWAQFTKSHFMRIEMEPGRKVISDADFGKLSPDAQLRAKYAYVWNEKGEQVYRALGGTYRLVGDKLHLPATVALTPTVVGVDRVWKTIWLDKTTLVAQTEYPDQPETTNELTYRRID